MRQKQITGDRQMQMSSKKEPLAETIQKERRPRDFFTKMSDTELISYAKKTVEEKGMRTRLGLQKADEGLYGILRKRNLLDTVISVKQKRRKQRNWSSMTDEELISHAETYIKENEIKNRKSLEKADYGLYQVLKRRNLLDSIILKNRRDWIPMSNGRLISYAKKFIEENGINSRKALAKADCGLYTILRIRNLLDAVIPDKMLRNWSSMTNKELVSYAKTYIEENKIKNRSGLEKAEPGLYKALVKRNLLDSVVSRIRKERRNWSSMSNKELVLFAKKFIEENAIKNRRGLQKADPGLYDVLRKRNLLDVVVPEKREKRDWSSISDEEFVSYAKTYIEEKQIKSRKGLEKADVGLYQALIRRNLLNAVFSDIEEAKKTAAVKQVVDAMKEFGGSG